MLIAMMYHYVHAEGDDPLFRGLHGIDTGEFECQLDFLCEHFDPVSHEDLLDYVIHNKALPKRGFCLSFDDGFKQHYRNVYPILKKRGLQGSFFIPTKPLVAKQLHTLEKQRLCQYSLFDDYALFLEKFHEAASSLIDKDRLAPMAPIKANIDAANDYLAQHSFYSAAERFYRFIRDELLSKDEFAAIIDKLFERAFDESEVVARYYLNTDEIHTMAQNGMCIGGHSHSHPHLDKLSPEAAYEEIAQGKHELEKLCQHDVSAFSYPFGSYNADTIAQLQKLNFHYAYTTVNRINEHIHKPYEITRVDAASFELVSAHVKRTDKNQGKIFPTGDQHAITQATNQEGLC